MLNYDLLDTTTGYLSLAWRVMYPISVRPKNTVRSWTCGLISSWILKSHQPHRITSGWFSQHSAAWWSGRKLGELTSGNRKAGLKAQSMWRVGVGAHILLKLHCSCQNIGRHCFMFLYLLVAIAPAKIHHALRDSLEAKSWLETMCWLWGCWVDVTCSGSVLRCSQGTSCP